MAMRSVPDGLLFAAADVAATLIGLLLVAVFFYLETGFRRLEHVGPSALPFLKATTALIVLQYSMVLGMSLALVVLEPLWASVAYAVLGLGVVVALVTWSVRARRLSPTLRRAVRIRPWLAWPIVLLPLVLPYAADGITPDRDAFTIALFLVGTVAFANTISLLLLAFDLSGIEAATAQPASARVARDAADAAVTARACRKEEDDAIDDRVRAG